MQVFVLSPSPCGHWLAVRLPTEGVWCATLADKQSNVLERVNEAVYLLELNVDVRDTMITNSLILTLSFRTGRSGRRFTWRAQWPSCRIWLLAWKMLQRVWKLLRLCETLWESMEIALVCKPYLLLFFLRQQHVRHPFLNRKHFITFWTLKWALLDFDLLFC